MMPLKWGVLRVRLAHDDWSTLTGEFNDVNVHVISSTPIPGKDKIIAIIEVYSDNVKVLKEFLDEVKRFHNIYRFEVIDSHSRRGRSIALVNIFTNFKGSITELVTYHDSYKYGEVMHGGFENWTILTWMRPQDFLSVLRERAEVKSYTWLSVKDTSSRYARGALTGWELEVLNRAYELGYFDWPRRVNLGELANILGVNKATLSQELRIIIRKLALKELEGSRKSNLLP
jgi:predicted DNA binding protein